MFGIFRKAPKPKPDLDASVPAARAHVTQGRPDAAFAIYEELVSAYPESGWVHADRGTARAMMGNTAAAIVDLQKAIALGYVHTSVYASLATAQMQEGNLAGAIANFGAAAALDGSNAFIYYNRATLLAKVGDHEGSRRDLEHCLRLGPDPKFEAAIRNKLAELPAGV